MLINFFVYETYTFSVCYSNFEEFILNIYIASAQFVVSEFHGENHVK